MSTRPKTGGRQAGTPNKLTSQLKDMILTALEKAGGIDYLYAQAHENPKTFLLLLGRVLPLQVTGDADNPIQQVIRWATEKEATLDPSKKSLSLTHQEQSGSPSITHPPAGALQ